MIGKVVKGIGGFYYVSDGKQVIQGNARGNLKRRKKDIILVGDEVEYEIRREDGECIITKVLPRKNFLRRPPVSNLDTLVIVSSAETPEMIPLAVDKLTVYCEYTGIRPILVFTKSDLVPESRVQELIDMYQNIYPTYPVSNTTGDGLEALRKEITGQSVALAGPSGVGKSTLLNALVEEAEAETGNLSDKTGRGKHTTRHVEIFVIDADTYIYDTPGFTSLDLPEEMERTELRLFFPEFKEPSLECRYGNCVHINEPSCGVKEALANQQIPKTRYESYLKMYEEVQKWQK